MEGSHAVEMIVQNCVLFFFISTHYIALQGDGMKRIAQEWDIFGHNPTIHQDADPTITVHTPEDGPALCCHDKQQFAYHLVRPEPGKVIEEKLN